MGCVDKTVLFLFEGLPQLFQTVLKLRLDKIGFYPGDSDFEWSPTVVAYRAHLNLQCTRALQNLPEHGFARPDCRLHSAGSPALPSTNSRSPSCLRDGEKTDDPTHARLDIDGRFYRY